MNINIKRYDRYKKRKGEFKKKYKRKIIEAKRKLRENIYREEQKYGGTKKGKKLRVPFFIRPIY